MSRPEVIFDRVSYWYDASTSIAKLALDGIDLTIDEGGFIALCGKTGSGKSTLAQHMDALLLPSIGRITYPGGQVFEAAPRYDRKGNIKAPKKRKLKGWKELRKGVGIVFQFPEDQIFKRTVLEDVMVGPINFGADEKEAREAAIEALNLVGLDESFYQRSPFELSGGEKRRVALAGVFAFSPRILILDEPTVGLDPIGASRIVEILKAQVDRGATVILITHDMDLAYSLARRLIVMEDGKIALDEAPYEAFQNGDAIHRAGLLPPKAFVYTQYLRGQGMDIDPEKARDSRGLAEEIARCLNG